ncbi:MAG: hypothetical protein OXE41_05900 [Gammaproteobacteria bacterium]|nr:hypothetical protein [Gammaproteobacteria bacterium]
MRTVQHTQMEIGEVRIEDIALNPKSRDDIPALLMGLQHLYRDKGIRKALFDLLDQHILPVKDQHNSRPSMELWQILAMGVLKQGLGCNYDQLHEFINEHRMIRKFLGHSCTSDDYQYHLQTAIENVELLTPELLVEVFRLVGESGHKVARKKAWRALAQSL